jgi:tetratricopeptide (TPR) repeat protein
VTPLHLFNATRAFRLFESGHFKLASREADWMLSIDQDCGQAWEIKACLRFEFHAYESALDAFERAGLLSPLRNESLIAWAECYGHLGRIGLAESLLVPLASRTHHVLQPELIVRVGESLERFGRLRSAYAASQFCLEQYPEYAPGYRSLARIAESLGLSPHLVESLLRRGLFLEPLCTATRIDLCRLFASDRRLAAVDAEVTHLLAIDHSSPESRQHLASLRDFLLQQHWSEIQDAIDSLTNHLNQFHSPSEEALFNR